VTEPVYYCAICLSSLPATWTATGLFYHRRAETWRNSVREGSAACTTHSNRDTCNEVTRENRQEGCNCQF
jgi:hypothetical protein